MNANRCRICHKDIRPGAGLVINGRLDPLCESCMANAPRELERHQAVSEVRRFEETAANFQGALQAARDDCAAAIRKVHELHGKVEALRAEVKQLREAKA